MSESSHRYVSVSSDSFRIFPLSKKAEALLQKLLSARACRTFQDDELNLLDRARVMVREMMTDKGLDSEEEAVIAVVGTMFERLVSSVGRAPKQRAASLDPEGVEELEGTFVLMDIEGSSATYAIKSVTEEMISSFIRTLWTIRDRACIRHKGRLVDQQGDGCAVFFKGGADGAANALRACMVTAQGIQEKNLLMPGTQKRARLRMGLDSGKAHCINIGGEHWKNFGYVGSPINRAARYELLCKLYGLDILTSSEFIAAMRKDEKLYGELGGHWRQIDNVQFVGEMEGSTGIYSVGDEAVMTPEYKPRFTQFLRYYFRGEWDDAREQAAKIQKKFPAVSDPAMEQVLQFMESTPDVLRDQWVPPEKGSKAYGYRIHTKESIAIACARRKVGRSVSDDSI